MSTQTWQKACDCKDATATSGRTVFSVSAIVASSLTASATWYPGPVCDSLRHSVDTR